jgi:AcrR family transcriptional regulator
MTTDVRASRLGRRERKKLATRQALSEAALALVLERGFNEVTVDAISAAADVSTRTFFNYFSSKEEAVLGDAPDPAAVRQAVLERPATETALEATCNVLGGLALEVSARREELLLREQFIYRHPTLFAKHLSAYARFEQAVGDAVAERLGLAGDADELYPRVVAAAVTAATKAAVQQWMQDAGRVPLSDLVAAAFAHLQHLDSDGAVTEPVRLPRAAGEA